MQPRLVFPTGLPPYLLAWNLNLIFFYPLGNSTWLRTQWPYWSRNHAAGTLRRLQSQGSTASLKTDMCRNWPCARRPTDPRCVSPGVNLACDLHPSWFAKPFQSLYTMQVLKLARTCKRHQDIDWVAHSGLTSLWLLLWNPKVRGCHAPVANAQTFQLIRTTTTGLTGSQPSKPCDWSRIKGSHKSRMRRTSKLSKKLWLLISAKTGVHTSLTARIKWILSNVASGLSSPHVTAYNDISRRNSSTHSC